MARLDYNEDNYFDSNNRGARYDIYINGYAEKTNLSENEVDYFLDIYEQRGFSASEIGLDRLERNGEISIKNRQNFVILPKYLF